MTETRFYIQDDGFADSIRELNSLLPEVLACALDAPMAVYNLLKSGSGLRVIGPHINAARGTLESRVLVKPSHGLLGLVTAMRTLKRELDLIFESHVPSPFSVGTEKVEEGGARVKAGPVEGSSRPQLTPDTPSHERSESEPRGRRRS